jgi:hypothetical protein
MSTRAFIARQTDLADNVFGCTFARRYHHFDGYPSGLGQFLAKALREQFQGDVESLLRRLIDSKAAKCGWSTILHCDLSLTPVSPEDHMRYYRAWQDNPGPQTEHDYHKVPVCYAARGTEEEDLLTQDSDLSWLDWGYIFGTYALEVWRLSYTKPPIKVAHIPYALLSDADWEKMENYD